MKKEFSHHLIAIAVTCLFSAALLFLPDPPAMNKGEFSVCRARVISVDDSAVELHGLLKFGSQRLEVEILSGKHKGRKFRANNELRAQMELDKEFKVNDIITVNMPGTDPEPDTVLQARDHHRSFWIWCLGAVFCVFLIIFGSWVGIKAISPWYNGRSCYRGAGRESGLLPLACRGVPEGVRWSAAGAPGSVVQVQRTRGGDDAGALAGIAVFRLAGGADNLCGECAAGGVQGAVAPQLV